MHLLICVRFLARRPLRLATALLLTAIGVASFVFFHFERLHGPPYDDILTAIEAVTVLALSGFDVHPPRTIAGWCCAYVTLALGMCYVALLTGIVAARIIGNRMQKGISSGGLRVKGHIIMCGWMNRSTDLLKQLFAPDLTNPSPVVIIDPDIEATPLDHPLLHVIRGNPTDAADLKRANIESAEAAIILADRSSADPNASDARSLLIVLAIETLNPKVRTCVEVLNPENAVHFKRVKADEIISVTELTDHLVLQAALCPGAGELISDMLRFDEGEEIYGKPVPPAFVGRTVTDLCLAMLRQYNVLLIGIRSGQRIVRHKRASHILQADDIIFILADSREISLERLVPLQEPAG
ncbi:MAG: NAD-binding protein [Candidatus Sumerlaeaceae bacterium]|nr:NAD-binding protein [Candidatus Sumerlaeaceae bacterium]